MSNEKNKELKNHFQNLIDRELQKPIEEQDSDLIKECVELIITLDRKTEECKLTQSDIDKAKETIFKCANTKYSKIKKIKHLRKGVIIACAILVSLLIISVVAIAFDWDYSIIKLLKTMNVGDAVNIDNIEIQKLPNYTQFTSYEDLINYTGYDILTPGYLPDRVLLNNIFYYQDDNRIIVTYDNDDIKLRYRVNNDFDSFNNILEYSTELIIAGYICYSAEIESNVYQIAFINDEMIYTFYGNNHEELIKVIESLK